MNPEAQVLLFNLKLFPTKTERFELLIYVELLDALENQNKDVKITYQKFHTNTVVKLQQHSHEQLVV